MPPLQSRIASALGDGVIRARVGAGLRGVALLVLNRVVGAREGHLVDGTHCDGIRGAIDRNFGDVVTLTSEAEGAEAGLEALKALLETDLDA